MSRSMRSLTLAAAATALAVLWPSGAYAQRPAVPRPPASHVVYRPYYGYAYPPHYYNHFYWGFGWGYGWHPWFYYPYAYPPYYGGYYYDDSASLRIQVKPNNAEVYVDGHYVGVVDSYDGMFQRLHLPPGDHAIEIYQEGFRSVRENMRFTPREGYELRRQMEPLAAGDTAPVRPKPDPDVDRDRDRDRRPAPRGRYEEPRDRQDRQSDVRVTDSGAVAIRVQPAGAIVLIDGEKWEGPDGPDRLVVHLSEGTHRIEIQKEGFRSFVTEVRIRRGETVPLNVSLRTAG
jgi:PEGA domain-containing protein